MVNVLRVEGGGFVKSFWTNSNGVITSYLNSLCSFNWIRYFSLLIQNSDRVFSALLNSCCIPHRQYLELESGGFSINSVTIPLCFPSLIRDLSEYWLIFTLLKSLTTLGYLVDIEVLKGKWPQGSSSLASFLHGRKRNC